MKEMKRGKKSLLLLVTMLLFLAAGFILPEQAQAASVIGSGSCGTNVNWTLDSAYTLTISGNGTMQDYDYIRDIPWESYQEKIQKIIIQKGVTSVGKNAFYHCYNASEIELSNDITIIGQQAFYYCQSIKEIELPEGLKKIDYQAFDNCLGLTTISLPSGSIQEGTFSNCSNLSTVRIGQNVNSIAVAAFERCSSLKAFYVDSGNADFCSVGGVLFDKAKTRLLQYPIKKTATSYEIPNTVENVDNRAFYGCESLISVTVPDSVINLGYGGYGVFQSCENLKTARLSKRQTHISNWTFAYCKNLETITIPGNIKYIDNNAFRGCTGLRTMYFRGDAPSVSNVYPTTDVTATAYYPSGNSTWTAEARNKFDGSMTWKTYTPSLSSVSAWNIELKQTSFTYNEKEQKPDVVVTDGTILMRKGMEYTVSYNNNINAGRATVKITGRGEYTGSISKGFTINKAPQKMIVDYFNTTIEKGSNVKIPVIAKGSVSYSSSNSAVASVNSNGVITGVAPGTATIQVSAEATANYASDVKKIQITVKESEVEPEPEPQKKMTVSELSYSFGNNANAFGYKSGDNIPLSSYQIIFGNTTKAKMYYASKSKGRKWGGNCAGLSSSSALLYDTSNTVLVSDFNTSAQKISDLKIGNTAEKLHMNLKTYIEAMQVAQYTQLFKQEVAENRVYTEEQLWKGSKNLNTLYKKVKEQTEKNIPVVIALYQQGSGHAVLAYEVKDISSTQSVISLYDNNYPLKERQLILKRNSGGDFTEWSYEIGGSHGTWGSHEGYSSISFVKYSTIEEIWDTRGKLEENENILSVNSRDVAIYDVEDKEVARLDNGKLYTKENDIQVVEDLSMDPEDTGEILLSVPVDVYTVSNKAKNSAAFKVSMTNVNLGAQINTTAGSVTLAVDDSCNNNVVQVINAKEKDTYSVTLNSTAPADKDEVVIKGKGNGETLEISQSKGNITINNCQIISVTIDGAKQNLDKYLNKNNSKSDDKKDTDKKPEKKTSVEKPQKSVLKKLSSAGRKKMLVRWNTSKNASGYQLQYSTSSKFKKGKTITVQGGQVKQKKISKLKKKTYYVRIRAYKIAAGKKYYSAWSAKKKIKIRR